MVVRELTGGIYFGRPSRQWQERRGRAAVDTMLYREHEIERVTRLAFELARGRRNKVASVDKANVLATSRLWRDVVGRVAGDYLDVELEHVLVDAMSMRLIRQPARFKEAYASGASITRGPLKLFALPNGLDHPRLGISIGRRVGTAPRRNRIKRLIREAFRLMQHDWPGGYDLVVVVRPHEPMILAEYQRALSGGMVKLVSRKNDER